MFLKTTMNFLCCLPKEMQLAFSNNTTFFHEFISIFWGVVQMKIHFWRVCFLCRKCLKNMGHDLLWYHHLGKWLLGVCCQIAEAMWEGPQRVGGSLTLCSESPNLQPPSWDQHLLLCSKSPLQEAILGQPISLGRQELPANPLAMVFFVFLLSPIFAYLEGFYLPQSLWSVKNQ